MIWKLIMRIFGWKIDEKFPKNLKRCVLIAVPHTSNWDFLFAIATFKIMKIDIRFTIKDTWVKFPFSLISLPLGAISIDRSVKQIDSKRKSMVDYMTELFAKNKDLVLIVTAEGTREKVEKWKSGFFYVAKNANVPIALGYLDYKNKIAGIRQELIYPTEIDSTMKEIMNFYKDCNPKFKENFSLDTRY